MVFRNPILGLIIMISIMTGSLIYAGSFFYFSKKARVKNLANHFNDTVQLVIYDLKGIPEVYVKGQRFYLTDGYNFNYKIEKGDSFIKQKGQTTYKLIKKRNRAVFLFNNR